MKVRTTVRSVVIACVVSLAIPIALTSTAAVANPTAGVWGWGAWPNNFHGQVGRGTTDGSPTPVGVMGLGTDVRDVAAGGSHSLAVMDDGRVYAWGTELLGALGNGVYGSGAQGAGVGVPTLVTGLDAGSGVIAVAAGGAHSLALTDTGGVLAWGDNSSGQLGDGTTVGSAVPLPVLGLTSGIIGISAGYEHSMALRADGVVLTWGSNLGGQLGVTDSITPLAVPGLTNVVQVSAGLFHSLARAQNGSVYEWGESAVNPDWAPGPHRVPTLGAGSGVIDIDGGGGGSSVAAKADGSMIGWGGGGLGQHCTTNMTTGYAPVTTDFGPGSGVVDVEAGWQSTLVRLADGSVYGCGYDFSNELGNGSGGLAAGGGAVTVMHPVQVAGFGAGSGATDIAAGFAHGLAIASQPTPPAPPATTTTTTSFGTIPPAPPYTASIGDITVSEGDSGTRTAAATISLDRVATTRQTVRVSTASGTASAGDYLSFANKLVTIAAGKASQTVAITLNGDTASEGDESFRLLVNGSATVQAVNSNGRVTVLDDDAPGAHTPSMSVSDVTAYESDGKTTNVSFMVALSEPSAAPISARFSTVGFTAALGVDFTARTNVVISFPSMVRSKLVTISVANDNIAEQDEAFFVTLGSAIGASIADGTGIGTIKNDDA